MAKLDFLKECNTHGVPLEDFKQQFCDRCFQPECTRSQHGGSKFERRVTTWEDRLFKNPPKMDRGDPRYQQISAKKFLTIQTPIQVRGQKAAWMDPRELVEKLPIPEVRIKTPVIPPILKPEPIPEPVAQKEIAQVVQKPPEPKTEPKQAPGVAGSLMNTPSVGAQMLQGHKKEEPPAKKDPWIVNPGVTGSGQSGDVGKVVQPGAKIRFGS
jgi:hypothetical protein